MGRRAVLVGGVGYDVGGIDGLGYGGVDVYCFDIDSKVSDCVSEQCVSVFLITAIT